MGISLTTQDPEWKVFNILMDGEILAENVKREQLNK